METLLVEEAAEFLGCSEPTLYRMIRRGSMEGTYYTVGKKKLFLRTELEKWRTAGGERQFEKPPRGKYFIQGVS